MLFRVLAAFLLFLLAYAPDVSAQTPTAVPVATWRYDLTHAGQNTSETLLTPANVNVNTFGKLFSLPVDSTVYAQPLYVPGLTMSDGKVHNVLFVATENDSIYAFDADSNGGSNAKPIWQISLLSAAYGAAAGATAIPWQDDSSPDVAPTVGITGTPVINPATNTMYVVGSTKENGTYYARLHAINILNGAEQHSPVVISATVAGTGQGAVNGQITFDPLVQNQRPALNYYNGHLYIGWAAHGDIGPWHGWLFSYDATTLQQTAALCLTPNGLGAGIWASGAGLPIDLDGSGGAARMFIVTGNTSPWKDSSGVEHESPAPNGKTELGESVVAFDITNGSLTPIDAFWSFNYATLNAHDWDQGSGGLLMVPDNNGPNPHMLITAGKEGRILVLNRDDLGGNVPSTSTSNTNILQDIPPGPIAQAHGLWSTPAYWNGNVYLWAENNVPMLFKLNDGVLDTAPDSQSTITAAFPAPSFTISSNGTENGIAWALRSDQFNTNGPAVLYAWNASDLTNTIYESDTNPTRDVAGAANKFSIPVVTNGKVYVATHGEVDVYGLLNGTPNAVAPVISPNGGDFGSPQTVQLSTTTGSASIYYTLDGSTPSPASTLYTAPITVNTDTTIKAIASAPGFIQSSVSTATFTFSDQTPLIVATPPGGTYLNAQTVTLSNPDANARIYYTTDGSTPSSSSTLYTGPIAVRVSETLKSIAIDPALIDSNIDTEAYVIQNGGVSINFANGFASSTGLTLNGSAAADNDTRLQLTDGGLNEAGSVFWNAPINIQAFSTTFTFQLSNAQANGFTFTIQNMGPTALGGDSAGLGYQDIQKSVAVKFNFYNYQNEGSDSTGIYTNGQPPVQPTVDLTPSGIMLNSNDAIQAQIGYDGKTLTLTLLDTVTNAKFTMGQDINIPQIVGGNTAYVGFTGGTGGLSASQKIATWVYTTQSVPPAFSPTAGTYATAQSVSLSSATAGAAIYFTTDGSSPTAASQQYSGPIPVAQSETIQAIAISGTYGLSNVASAAYVIASNVPPVAGFTLNTTQSVSVGPGSNTTSIITITPTNGFTGAVALTCAANGPSGAPDPLMCSVTQPTPISGSTAVTAILTANTDPDATPGTYIVTVTGTSGSVTATTSVQVTITASTTTPLFTLKGSSITIPSVGGQASSVITITPNAGFTGSVVLACAISGQPTGAVNPPTCAVSQPQAIAGTQAVSATLTVSTTGATTAMLHDSKPGPLGFGGVVLAGMVFFFIPVRRRKWLTMVCVLFAAIIVAAVSGCSGGSLSTQPTTGTTAGTYTVTITGTSGSQQAATTISVVVQ